MVGGMNDLRIYDECLSLKQIKEISKGLVAHYKLEGIGANIKKGEHSIKLMCSVTGGALNIPYYDINSALYTIKPELSSKLIIIGQNWTHSKLNKLIHK